MVGGRGRFVGQERRGQMSRWIGIGQMGRATGQEDNWENGEVRATPEFLGVWGVVGLTCTV